jgi:hypothetical protein
MIRSALLSVLTEIGTPSSLDVQQIADEHHAISVSALVSRQPQPSPPEVVQYG